MAKRDDLESGIRITAILRLRKRRNSERAFGILGKDEATIATSIVISLTYRRSNGTLKKKRYRKIPRRDTFRRWLVWIFTQKLGGSRGRYVKDVGVKMRSNSSQ